MIEEKQLNKIAKLSRLNLSDDEKNALSEDLNQILKTIQLLDELDLKDVEPMTQTLLLENVYRKDLAKTDEATSKAILKQSPESQDDFFLVPKIIS